MHLQCLLSKTVFPRIHELLRYLASTTIVKNTISSLASSQHNETSSTSQQPQQQNDFLVADQISFTACILLHSLPAPTDCNHYNENDLSHCVIVDLVTLLFDLSVIFDSNVLLEMNHGIDDCEKHENDGAGSGGGEWDSEGDICNDHEGSHQIIECLILNQINAVTSTTTVRASSGGNNTDPHKSGSEHEYVIEIGSTDELLSLQSGVFHLLFKLLVLQYERRHSDDYILQESTIQSSSTTSNKAAMGYDGDEEDSATSTPRKHFTTVNKMDDSSYFAPFLGSNDVRSSLLASIRQVLVTTMHPKPTNQHFSPSSSFVQTTILALRNKVFASNLLLLILPDLSLISTEGDCTGTSALWFELMSLVVHSVHTHFQFMTNTLLRHLKYTPNSRGAGLAQLHCISELSASLCSILVTLIRDVFMCPLTPFAPSQYTMWNMRSKLICTLFDSIHHIEKLANACPTLSPSLSKSIKDLSMATLRAIQVVFSCDGTISDGYSEIGIGEKEQVAGNNQWARENEMMKSVVRDHCALRNIFPFLFDLLRHTSMMTSAISIIIQLPSHNDEYPSKQTLLTCACVTALSAEEKATRGHTLMNKRRKISKEYDRDDDNSIIKKSEALGDGISDASLLTNLSNFLRLGLHDAVHIIETSKVQSRQRTDYSFAEVVNIVSSIRLIHAFVGLDSSIRDPPLLASSSVIALISELYEACKIISYYVSDMANEKNISAELTQNVLLLLELCVGILVYARLATNYEGDACDIGGKEIATSRSELMSILSNTALFSWKMTSKMNDDVNRKNNHQTSIVKEFDSAILKFLHEEHINQLSTHFAKCRRCSYELGCHPGFSYKNTYQKFNYSNGRIGVNDDAQHASTGHSTLFLIEEIYSLQLR